MDSEQDIFKAFKHDGGISNTVSQFVDPNSLQKLFSTVRKFAMSTLLNQVHDIHRKMN